jgi:hypothetical protein
MPDAFLPGMMSISARARHVMSAMLIVVVAGSMTGWKPIERTAHCQPMQDHCDAGVTTESTDCVVDDACDQQMLVCCALPAPLPVDQAPLPQAAPSPADADSATLVDTSREVLGREAPPADITSPHWVRVLDLPILHQTFLI